MTKLIAWLTALLVLIVAAMSFALSYYSLQAVALTNGVPVTLSYIWPLLIDFSLVVFSVTTVSASLHKESTWRQWVLTGAYTIATIGFNTLHAYPEMLPQLVQRVLVTCVPPLSLFFSFELLMSQLGNSVKRMELSTTTTQLAGIVDTYNQKLAEITQRIDTTTTQVHTLQQQAQKVTDNTITGRREQLAQMIHNAQAEGIKLTQRQMGEQLGVSLTTIRGDIKAMNGSVK